MVYFFMPEVKLFAKTVMIENHYSTEDMLNTIAGQSRVRDPTIDPTIRKDLFKDTIKWGHDSIQEFVDYIFHIKGVSRTLLAQLTRHRMASYNVMSHRHVHPKNAVCPKGFVANGTIQHEDGGTQVWSVSPKDNFKSGGHHMNKVPLEDIRMLYPSAVTTNLFMKMNGRSLRNFLKLRTSEHAQWEIRELAIKIYNIVEQDCPTLLNSLDPVSDLKTDLRLLIESLDDDELDTKYIADSLRKKLDG